MKRYYWMLLVLLGLWVVAQDSSLPGVKEEGNYTQGTLGQVLQPLPVTNAQPDGVYSVGAWPQYTPELADGPGKELVQSYCQVCHSSTYITMQPPLPAATWDAEVQKMIKTFGAQIPDDAAKQITAYLQAHYTPETRKQ